ncbi:MAG: hypothetical protein PHP44_08965 [Kiritimatiellae bacterium]|nr:hypothetical protein [Kiritimatiellia bacterium]
MDQSIAKEPPFSPDVQVLSCRDLAAFGWEPGVQFVVQDWRLRIRAKDILRSQGMDPDVIRERRPALYALAERVQKEARDWITPRLTYRIYPVEDVTDTHVLLRGGLALARKPFAPYVRQVSHFLVILFTVGAELDRQVQDRSAKRLSEGMMLDALGNAAMAQFMHLIQQVLSVMVRRANMGTPGILIQPGVRDWPLEEGQPALFGLVEGSAIDVELRESGLMIPSKTCSGIIAIGADVTTADQITPCDMCMMKNTCPYRGNLNHDNEENDDYI